MRSIWEEDLQNERLGDKSARIFGVELEKCLCSWAKEFCLCPAGVQDRAELALAGMTVHRNQICQEDSSCTHSRGVWTLQRCLTLQAKEGTK
jgi:hypothetical protein